MPKKLSVFLFGLMLLSCRNSGSQPSEDPQTQEADVEEEREEGQTEAKSEDSENTITGNLRTDHQNQAQSSTDTSSTLESENNELHSNDLVSSPSPSYAPQPLHWCRADQWRLSLFGGSGSWNPVTTFNNASYSKALNSCRDYLSVEMVSVASADKRCVCCSD